MLQKTEYKVTEIGEIPKEWDVIRLEEICEKITDGSHFSPKGTDKGTHKIATVANIKKNLIDMDSCKTISEEDYKELVKNGCKPEIGDVLFTKDGTVGLSFVFNQKIDLVLLSSIAIIRPKEILNSDYCSYALRAPIVSQKITGSKRGTGLKRIILDDIRRVKIPLPPLSEQHKISEILSSIDTRIDIAERERQIIERLKVGIMKKLFDNEEWKIVTLGEEKHFEMIMGQSPPSESYNKEKSGLPFLQGNADFGPINPTPRIYCSNPIKVAKKGDVLISVRAPVGEVNIANADYCIGRGLGAIRSREEINNGFLFYYLLHSKQQLDSISGGSTFKAVTKSQLEKFRIPLPPLHEQQKIAEALSTLDQRLSLHRLQKSKLDTIKKGLMNDLLTGRKRVKV